MSADACAAIPSPPELPVHRRRRVARRVWGSVAALVLGTVATVAAWNEWTHRLVRTAQARFREAGLPATIAEVRPKPVPDADNAYPLVQRIVELSKTAAFAGSPSEEGVLTRLRLFNANRIDYCLDDAGATELATLLDEAVVREMTDLLRQAAAKAGYNAAREYERGAGLEILELGPLQSGVQLLRARARLAVNRGDMEEACACLWAILGTSEFFRDEPMLIGQIMRVVFLVSAKEGLNDAVNTAPLPPGWLTRFRERIQTIDLSPGLMRGMDGERVCMGDIVFPQIAEKPQMLQSLLEEGESDHTSLFRQIPRGFFRIEHAEYLDRIWGIRAALADTTASYSERVARARKVVRSLPRRHALVGVILPTIGGVGDKIFRMQTLLAVIDAGLATEEYRAREGRYPASLSELAVSSPGLLLTDPYGGQPLVFRVEGRGVILYSIGPNLSDDRGVLTFDGEADDLAWHGKFAPATGAAAGTRQP